MDVDKKWLSRVVDLERPREVCLMAQLNLSCLAEFKFSKRTSIRSIPYELYTSFVADFESYSQISPKSLFVGKHKIYGISLLRVSS